MFKNSFCFINAHFASGQKKIKQRNLNFDYIKSINLFTNINYLPQTSDIVIFLGDFNYRINLIKNYALKCIEQDLIEKLLKNDQLLKEKQESNVFKGYTEAEIKFPPTYKFDKNTNNYDTSKKNRIPAYCDRILFKLSVENKFEIQKYICKSDELISDHRPVLASLVVQINQNKLKFSKVVKYNLLDWKYDN